MKQDKKKQYQRPVTIWAHIDDSSILTTSDTTKPRGTVQINNGSQPVDPTQSLGKKNGWTFDDSWDSGEEED